MVKCLLPERAWPAEGYNAATASFYFSGSLALLSRQFSYVPSPGSCHVQKKREKERDVSKYLLIKWDIHIYIYINIYS